MKFLNFMAVSHFRLAWLSLTRQSPASTPPLSAWSQPLIPGLCVWSQWPPARGDPWCLLEGCSSLASGLPWMPRSWHPERVAPVRVVLHHLHDYGQQRHQRLELYRGSARGLRIWFFVCFLMSFASFTGKHFLNVWKDLDLAQDDIFRKRFQLTASRWVSAPMVRSGTTRASCAAR